MRRTISLFVIILFISLSFFSTQINGQSSSGMEKHKLPPQHFAPDREFDLVNIKLELGFNLDKKELKGKAIEKITPLRD